MPTMFFEALRQYINSLRCITFLKRSLFTRKDYDAPPATVQSSAKPGPQCVDIADGLKRANNNPSLAKDMIQFLVESLPENKTQIINALNSADKIQLERVAHRLYGACCYAGVPALRAASQQLEQALQNTPQGNIQSLAHTMLTEIEYLQQWADKGGIGRFLSE